VKGCLNRRHGLAVFFAVALLLSLALPARCQDSAVLPARNWNDANLKEIKAPASGPLTFAVLGDSRDNPAVFGKLLQQIDRDPGFAFAIHLGDMVRKADLGQYKVFFQEVRQNLHKPIVAVIGNHELNGKDGLGLYHDMFGSDDFSFQVGKNYFIALNDSAKSGLSEVQLRWLEKELEKSQHYRTRVVLCHIPLYDPQDGEHPASLPPQTARRLMDLFQKYRVTHIFAAHKHSYFAGKWDGIPFTITGGAGAELYGHDPRHFFYHYLKVSIKGDRVQIQVRPLEPQGGQ
jgi:predicted phosphodiesterase